METKITTKQTGAHIYRVLRAAKITSTGSGDFKDMLTCEEAHVIDLTDYRVITCCNEAFAARVLAALDAQP